MRSPFRPPTLSPLPLHIGLSCAVVIFWSSARRSATGNSLKLAVTRAMTCRVWRVDRAASASLDPPRMRDPTSALELPWRPAFVWRRLIH